MLHILSNIGVFAGSKSLISALMLSAATMNGETKAPAKTLSFDASVYVTTKNKIRIAVEKETTSPVTIVLRDQDKKVLYFQTLGKKETKMAAQMDVSDLTDGTYEIEFASKEGSIKKQVDLKTPVQKPARTITML